MEIYKGTRIPSSSSEWSLYTSKSGSAEAARKLTGVLKKAMRHYQKTYLVEGVATARDQAYEMIWKVQCEYADQGAADTEPNYSVREAMGRFIDKMDLPDARF